MCFKEMLKNLAGYFPYYLSRKMKNWHFLLMIIAKVDLIKTVTEDFELYSTVLEQFKSY